jgi:uncharacterized protein (DUF2147 family)
MYLTGFARISVAAGVAVLAAALSAAGTTAQSPAADVTGVWIDHTGQGAVEIAPCGSRICGRVVWLKNPDHRSKSGKRICGAQVLGGLHRESANDWEDGWIYNPEDEERFDVSLQLASANILRVTGYLGIKMLGETFIWRRATGSLERCAVDAAAH